MSQRELTQNELEKIASLEQKAAVIGFTNQLVMRGYDPEVIQKAAAHYKDVVIPARMQKSAAVTRDALAWQSQMVAILQQQQQ